MTQDTLIRRHTLSVIDNTGDTKTIWDPSNDTEVEIARSTFNALRKKNYLIYHVKGNGEKGKAMTEFDPSAEKMIAVPNIVGG